MRRAIVPVIALLVSACGSQSSPDAVDPGVLVEVRRASPAPEAAARDRLIGETLAQANAMWSRQFARFGDGFYPGRAVLYDRATASECRMMTVDEATFCRADGRIYLGDERWRASDLGGDDPVAQAVTVAHEVGHVVQKQTGVYGRTIDAIETAPPDMKGRLNAKLEQQADCYAGMWFREGPFADDPSALARAERSRHLNGDDTRQVNARGWHDPNEVSHGLSSERVAAFRKGLARGDPDDCGFDL